MAVSSAPGTLYSALAGIIIAAMTRRSPRCRVESMFSADMSASIKEIGQPALHLVGDVERDGLNGGGRVHPARGDEDAAVDDEQVLHVMRPAPRVHHGTCGIGAHPRGAEQVPAAIGDRTVDADVGRAGGVKDLLA